jgi:hypothetical protein
MLRVPPRSNRPLARSDKSRRLAQPADASIAPDSPRLVVGQPSLSSDLDPPSLIASSPPAPYLHPLLPADRLGSRAGARPLSRGTGEPER